jgi:hypothetical protein
VTTLAWLAGQPIDEAALLAHLGPGLAPAEGAAPLPGLAWNRYGYALGVRLLRAYAEHPNAKQHVLEACSTALAIVGGLDQILADPQTLISTMMVEATLHPFTRFADSDAATLLFRMFRWGTRRVRRDRRLADSLAQLAAEACDAHAELAALLGRDASAAREAERTQQLADARTMLAGESERLLPGRSAPSSIS